MNNHKTHHSPERQTYRCYPRCSIQSGQQTVHYGAGLRSRPANPAVRGVGSGAPGWIFAIWGCAARPAAAKTGKGLPARNAPFCPRASSGGCAKHIIPAPCFCSSRSTSRHRGRRPRRCGRSRAKGARICLLLCLKVWVQGRVRVGVNRTASLAKYAVSCWRLDEGRPVSEILVVRECQTAMEWRAGALPR